jgi:PAS domain S-box-containing protein
MSCWSVLIGLGAGGVLLSGLVLTAAYGVVGVAQLLAGGLLVLAWSNLERRRSGESEFGLQQQARLDRVLEATQDGVWEFDMHTRRFFCSERGYQLTGMPPDDSGELAVRTILHKLNREQRHRLLRALREALNESGRFDELVSVQSAAGGSAASGAGSAKRWLRVRARVTPDRRFITGVYSDVSEEVELTRERGLNQNFIEGVLDSLPLPVSVKTAEGVVVLANRAYCDSLSVQAWEVMGKTTHQIIPSDVADRLTALDRLTLETGGPHTIEDWFSIPRVRRRSFMRITKCRCVDRTGQPVVITIFEDQTSVREYADKMAQLSMNVEAFVQRMFRAIPYPLYVKNAESRYLMANAALAEQWGVRLEDMIGASSSELFGEERGQQIEAEDRRIFAGEVVRKEDCIPDRQTGRPRYWMVSKAACTDVDGNSIIVGANFEITELRRAEIELREALQQQTHLRQFMQQLFDALPHPICVKDAQHRFIMTNRAHADFHGLRPQQIIGSTTADYLEPEATREICDDEDALFASPENAAIKESEAVVSDAQGEVHQFLTRRIVCRGIEGERVILAIAFDVSEMRRLEANLRDALARQSRSQAFLRDIFDAIPTPVTVKDRDHRYVMVNRALASLYGRQPEELIGKTTADINLPEVARQTMDADDRLFAIGPGVVSERNVPLLYADRIHQVRLQKVVCLDPDGIPLLITSNSDVTELVDKENALVLSLQRQTKAGEFLQTVFDMLPFATYVKDESSRWVLVNTALSDFFGQPRHAFTGRSIEEFVRSAEVERISALDRELLERDDGEVRTLELVINDRLGAPRTLVIYEKLARDADGKRVIIGINHDVTELREIEHAQQLTLERLDTLINNAPLGIGLLDAEGHFLRVNPALQKMLGRTEDSLRGISYLGIMSSRQVLMEEQIRSIHETGVWQPDTSSVIDVRGQEIPVLASGVAVQQRGKEPVYWALLQDISTQKQAEDELLRHRDQLRQLVLEQTQDLLRAKEAAERNSAAKSELIAQLSHELRTPLHAILSFARLGLERSGRLAPEKIHEYFGRVAESGERLIGLLDALLDLAKLESGRISLAVLPANLPRLLDEVEAEFEALLIANHLDLSRIDAAQLPLISMDAPRIAQVMRNLMSNAIKFAPQGSRITLQTRLVSGQYGRRAHDQPEDTMVEVTVIDEGPGIPEDELEQIFDRFTQSSLTRDVAGGTGLGLAICREIVMAHRGEIYARNGTRGGAEFIVRLPVGGADGKHTGDGA